MTLSRKGDHHSASIILNWIIEHLDPFSPNIREQCEATNQLNAMLHESAMAGHDPTLAAKLQSGSVTPDRANTDVSCDMCFEHNKRKTLSSAVCLWMEASLRFVCLFAKVICEKHWCRQANIDSDAAKPF